MQHDDTLKPSDSRQTPLDVEPPCECNTSPRYTCPHYQTNRDFVCFDRPYVCGTVTDPNRCPDCKQAVRLIRRD